MNRRHLLKLFAAAGTGALATGLFLPHAQAAGPSFFLVTDRPEADLAWLRRALGRKGLGDAGRVAVTTHALAPGAPARQDLSVLHDGRLVDPTRGGVPAALAAMAAALRARPAAGSVLLTVEPVAAATRSTSARVAVIAQDGRVCEHVDLARDYDRIVVPGVVGPTVFRVRAGRLSVVEASCRHGLCARMGARRSGRLLCAPNRLVATLGGSAGLDGVTG